MVWLALIENERTYISCDGFVYLGSKLSDEIVSNTYARCGAKLLALEIDIDDNDNVKVRRCVKDESASSFLRY